MNNVLLQAYLCGAASLVVIYLLSLFFTGRKEPWALALGHNGGLSTSLLQVLLFTSLTVFVFVTTVFARFFDPTSGGNVTGLPNIPIDLLILMGLASATAIGSKQITIDALADGRVSASDNSTVSRNRDGSTDLTKVQMVIWMVVAIAVYTVGFIAWMRAGSYKTDTLLPDIDATFLVLMGLSQGAYVAGKLVGRTGRPQIEAILPAQTVPGQEVKITGVLFGDSKVGNDLLLVDSLGAQDFIPAENILDWTDTAIRFSVPQALPGSGKPMKGMYQLAVRTALGVSGTGTLTVGGKEPAIEKVRLAQVKPDAELALLGKYFGNKQAGNELAYILSNGMSRSVAPEQIEEWSDNRIVFKVPDDAKADTGIKLSVRTKDQESDWTPISMTNLLGS